MFLEKRKRALGSPKGLMGTQQRVKKQSRVRMNPGEFEVIEADQGSISRPRNDQTGQLVDDLKEGVTEN